MTENPLLLHSWDTLDNEFLKYCFWVWMLRSGDSPGSKLSLSSLNDRFIWIRKASFNKCSDSWHANYEADSQLCVKITQIATMLLSFCRPENVRGASRGSN